jgi:hypothetical protein
VTKLWPLFLTLSLLLPLTAHGRPADGDLTLTGRSQHWQVTATFTPAEFWEPHQAREMGAEFDMRLTYLGPETRVRWYRVEPLLPARLPLRVSAEGDTRCVWEAVFVDPKGERFGLGSVFPHGKCQVRPWSWQGGSSELAGQVSRGVFVVAWEDQAGVHVEGVRVEGQE